MIYKRQLEYPIDNPKVTKKKLKSGIYVYFEIAREYNPVTKQTKPKRVCVGKLDSQDEHNMFPNEKFFTYFPDSLFLDMPDEVENQRSSCISVGAYIAIKIIIKRLKLDNYLNKAVNDTKICGTFLDFVTYEILEQSNVAQHFTIYAFRHPLFVPDMVIYSDSTLSRIFQSLTNDQRQVFLNVWNDERNKRERIYVSYDSSNRHTKAGEIEEAEYGKAKDGLKEPIINQGTAYDCDNREPLFYESYPGSIVDISMLEYMVQKAKGYGYKNISFILDRGYFSRENLFFMDQHNYGFIIMAKGAAKFLRSLVEEAMGTFEVERKNFIQKFMVYGTTIYRKVFPEEKRDKIRNIHVYYNEYEAAVQRNKLEKEIFKLQLQLEKRLGKKTSKNTLKEYSKYFNLDIKEEILEGFKTKDEFIENEKFWMGYFCIVTSEEMTAKQALYLYKGRDHSEKLFLSDKTFLGNETYRVGSEESKDTKEWIGFVAEIILPVLENILLKIRISFKIRIFA